MKIKNGLVCLFSKNKHVSPRSKLIKQKKLKPRAISSKKHKMEELTIEKLNHAVSNKELISKLKTKTEGIKTQKDNFNNQSNLQDLRETNKIGKGEQIKLNTRYINIEKGALRKEKPNLSIRTTKLSGKLKTKEKKDNFKAQSIVQTLEKVKKTGKDKQIKPRSRFLNNKEVNSLKKEKPNLAINATKLARKLKPTKSKKEILKTQVGVKKIVKENTTLMTKGFNPSSVMTKNQNKIPNESPKSGNVKPKSATNIDSKIDDSKYVANKMSLSKLRSKVEEMRKNQLHLKKVTAAVTALFKVVKADQTQFLNLAEPIFMEVECIKIPICPTKQLRFKLPHPLINELSDILLITADKKGAKIYSEKAVDHYTELLAKHDINFIQQVIPLRSICKEYSQYELRKKLVDQYDMILADATIINSLGNQLGKHVLYKRKMPLPVHLDRKNLKQHLLMTISKTQMTIKSNGHLTTVQVGHTKMDADEVAANILAVAQSLDSVYPGGFKNIRSLDIKTSNSISLPVFFSTVPSHAVETPVVRLKPSTPLVGELSTQLNCRVVVKSDGTVLVRRTSKPSTLLVDDSQDDEILKAAKEYKQSAKTVHYDEGDTATATTEEKLLKQYNLVKKKKEEDSGEEDEQEEEEEEESSDEEEPIALPIGQKRKKGLTKKQASVNSPDKKQKKVHQQGKFKESTQKKEVKKSEQIKKGDQRRGSRGGKKQKMKKDQRKALIKRKKAEKK